MKRLINFLRDDTGSNASEYALILALVAVAIIVGVTLLGTNINSKVNTAATTIGP
jgi:pilus assembly protein Flp/PilA